MDKPIIYYEARPQVNRATGATIMVPAIVEREQSVPLEEIVRRAIDRGLIAGVKESYANQIGEAIAQQMYDEFKAGRGVKFGQYFYARLYLDGTTDSNGKLTDKNRINVRFVNGAKFKLNMSDFTFTNVNGGEIPGADFLISDDDGAERGKLIPNKSVMLNGVNLYKDGDVGTRVNFYEWRSETDYDTTPTAEVTTFTSRGPNLLVFAWPSALVAGKTYLAEPARTPDGSMWYTGKGKTALVVAE